MSEQQHPLVGHYLDGDVEAGLRAIAIIVEVIDPLHNQIMRAGDPPTDSEIVRLDQQIPDEPLSFMGTVMAGLDTGRYALDHIALNLHHGQPPHLAPVLHPLMRTALISAARVLTPLLPADPDVRLTNARGVLWRDADGLRPALNQFAEFRRLRAFKPDRALMRKAEAQRNKLKAEGAEVTESQNVARMIAALTDAMALSKMDRQVAREDSEWLWNIYSGTSHAQSWARLLPQLYGDGVVITGNFLGDLLQVASLTQIGMWAVIERSRPGTAGTTDPVDLTDTTPTPEP